MRLVNLEYIIGPDLAGVAPSRKSLYAIERVSVILTRLHFLTSTLHHSLASDSRISVVVFILDRCRPLRSQLSEQCLACSRSRRVSSTLGAPLRPAEGTMRNLVSATQKSLVAEVP